MISVVIRAKNEAPWIRRCLTALSHQDAHPVEVIVMDNASTDETVRIAESFGAHLLHISDEGFSFGRALNLGIADSTGEFVVSLSAHCIPLSNRWLDCLVMNFADPKVAAVYGRQEPLPDSDDFDKRDLWTTFGVERRVQRRDYFFHNANSMIHRQIWERLPFDEGLSGVEDRDWAKKVLALGYEIVYEPLASVAHHHGIHQGRNVERCQRVVKVIEFIQQRDLTLDKA